jgi:hypothetical protein
MWISKNVLFKISEYFSKNCLCFSVRIIGQLKGNCSADSRALRPCKTTMSHDLPLLMISCPTFLSWEWDFWLHNCVIIMTTYYQFGVLQPSLFQMSAYTIRAERRPCLTVYRLWQWLPSGSPHCTEQQPRGQPSPYSLKSRNVVSSYI